MFVISACLLGKKCKYSGGSNENAKVMDFASKNSIFQVCPEVEGGLSVPRPPAEIKNGRVVNKEGRDVTENFVRGSCECFNKAVSEAEKRGEKIEGAILKSRSPSCGSGRIYDGTFSGTLTDGNGLFAELLRKNGIRVMSEEDDEIYR